MAKNEGKILIALSGGGTGGPVVPLLNVAKVLGCRHPEVEFLFFGTARGPEVSLVANEQNNLRIKYLAIGAGKFRRYFSWRNFSDFFVLGGAFFQSLYLLAKYRPRVIFTVGAFVAVPPAWAARLLGIPVFMHQQDIRPGLANQLIAPFSASKTVAFEKSLADYRGAVWIGIPVDEREMSEAPKNVAATRDRYHLSADKPLLLITGGGTGAESLNELVLASLPLINNCQIIHLSGDGKKRAENDDNYQSFAFLPHTEILKLIAASDLVVSRCGLSTLTELSLLAKPAILIPMPKSHQEENAALFSEAALVLSQEQLTPAALAENIQKLLADKKQAALFSEEIKKIIKPGAAEFLAEKIYEYSRKKN